MNTPDNQKINLSNIKYKNLIEEQSLFGVCLVQHGVFKFVNKKFLELFGYRYKDVIDKLEFIEIVSREERDQVREVYEKILNGSIKNEQFNFSARHFNGEEIDVEVWCGKVNYDGTPALQSIIADISDKTNYQVRMMNEQKLAAIGQVATGIAHNLNTPISVILSNAELLQIKHPDSQELLKIIRQAERMSNIINTLLTKSKQEQIHDTQPVNLNKLITNELEFLDANLEFKHNVVKEYKFAEDLPKIRVVYSDFSQSIMNILQNAIDAMYGRTEKKLIVETRVRKNKIYVSITDTGIGIKDRDNLKIFDPFFTTKPSPLEREGDEPTGTGLGLSTVYNLLKPYGIKIDVVSEYNKGTTFNLIIPFDRIRVEEAPPE
jgi:PAS domain S-box-containing protein